MSKSTKLILFILGALLFCYTATRAYLLSITWDEAYSFTEFVRKGEIAYPQTFGNMSANNHLLITWMDKILVKCFGVSELILRLPSLMAHLLFLVYSAKLLIRFKNNWLIIASFLIINLNPYLLDFFSLARGYGLSVGLMMASIYYLYAFQQEFKNKFASVSLLFAGVSVLANYVLLNFFLGLFSCVFFLYALRAYNSDDPDEEENSFWKNILAPVSIFIGVMLLVLPIAFGLRKAGALYFGADNDFWTDTVRTIVDRWFYEIPYNYWFQRMAKAFIVCILFSSVVLIIIRLLKKQLTYRHSFFVSIVCICLFCVGSTIAQHYLLHTLYLIDRTALFFTVLFALILVFFVQDLMTDKPQVVFISYIAAAFLTVHMVLSFNLIYALEWKWDANTKQMLADLEELKEVPPEKQSISISIPLLFESGINFYRGVHHLNWLNTATRSKKRALSDDYYYLSPKELAAIHPDSIEILRTYPFTNNALVKPKFKWKHPQLFTQQELKFDNEPGQSLFIDSTMEYSKTISCIIPDSVAAFKHSIIVFETLVMSLDLEKSDIRMVISMDNEKGNYSWDGVSVQDFIVNPNEWTKATLTAALPEKIKAGDKLSMYLWNYVKGEVYLKEMRFKWLKYD
ncbi:MAG TPA: hypothetical protein VFF27_18255 [Bacteroidia bacterium]|jgi:hypothetical protein|nr:hypothetical protein [Bacteroidia bacterium]